VLNFGKHRGGNEREIEDRKGKSTQNERPCGRG